MAKRNPLHIPFDFEAMVKALLGTPPPPSDTQGSQKVERPEARKRKAPTKRR